MSIRNRLSGFASWTWTRTKQGAKLTWKGFKALGRLWKKARPLSRLKNFLTKKRGPLFRLPKLPRVRKTFIGALVVLGIIFGAPAFPWTTGVLALCLMMLFGIYLALNYLAHNKNVLFTVIEPGQGKFIMRGGKLEEVLIGDLDRFIDDDYCIARLPKGQQREQGFWEQHFGWRYVGFLRHVHTWRMKWYEPVDGNDLGKGLLLRDEVTDFFFHKAFTYGLRLTAAEAVGPCSTSSDTDQGPERLSLDLDSLVTVYILNPVKAIFRVEDVNQRLMSLIGAGKRRYVARSTYDSLQREGDDEGPGQMWEFLKNHYPDAKEARYTADRAMVKDLGGHDGYLYFRRFGMLVDTVELAGISLHGDEDGKLADALTAQFIATNEARAEIERAKGDKQATVLRSEGDKIALENRADGLGKVAQEVYIKTAGSPGLTATVALAADRLAEEVATARAEKGGKKDA